MNQVIALLTALVTAVTAITACLIPNGGTNPGGPNLPVATTTTTSTTTTTTTSSTTTTTILPALINIAGAETGSTEANATNGTFSVVSSPVRTGSYGYRVNPTTTSSGYVSFGTNGPTGAPTTTVGDDRYATFAFRYATKPASNDEPIAAWRASAAYKCEARLDSDGKLRMYSTTPGLLGTGATVLAQDTWYVIGLYCGTGANAAYELRVNGVTELSGTGDMNTGQNEAFRVGKVTNRNGNSVDFFYDDISIATNTFPHDGKIAALLPTANGSTQQWASGTNSSNHLEVDERPHDTDTTYVQSDGSAGHAALFDLTDATDAGISGQIHAVKGFAICREPSSVTSSNLVRVRVNATNSDTSGTNHTTSYAARFKFLTTDPSDAGAWSAADIDDLEVGIVESNAVAMRCTAVGASVAYTSTVTTTTTTSTTTTTTTSTTTTTTILSGDGLTSATFTEDTTSLLYNPNVGLTSANGTTGSSKTNPNGWPITMMEDRWYWRQMEPSDDSFDFSEIKESAILARADLQTLNGRLPYVGNVGDCATAYSDPAWLLTAAGGWTATHSECGTAYNYVDLEGAVGIAEWAELITEAEATMASYPAWKHGFFESGYGSYGENSFDSTVCASTVGGADACTVGAAIPQYTVGEISPWWDAVLAVNTTIRKMNMVDNYQLFDQIYDNHTGDAANAGTTGSAGGTRADCWRWGVSPTRTCPSSGLTNSLMCGVYARTFFSAPGSPIYSPAHVDMTSHGMLFLETCGNMSSWSSYDYANTFSDALAAGASGWNPKGTFDLTYGGGAARTAFTSMLRTMGYRYYISEVRNTPSVDLSSGAQNVRVDIYTTNRGVAPDYDGMVWMVKFVEQGVGLLDRFRYTSAQTLAIPRNGSQIASLTIELPDWLDNGTYDIFVGAGFDDPYDFPYLAAAVSPASDTRWYQAGEIEITNSSPTSNPVGDYGRDFEADDTEYLELASHSTIQADINTVHVDVALESKAADGVIVAKGTHENSAVEFSVYYDQSADRFVCEFGAGSASRRQTATSCGSPATDGTVHRITSRWNNTTKVITCDCDFNTDTSSAFSGSKNSNSSAVRIGADIGGNYIDGKVGRVYLYNTRISDACVTELQNGTNFSDFSFECRRGLIAAQDLEDSGGDTEDSFQHWVFSETSGTIPQAEM